MVEAVERCLIRNATGLSVTLNLRAYARIA